ncbi:Fis family transcriptional regulator [Candidatus Dependentiae bacterium]|nr:Fis family transcriptional regulator [Candidatus Dependentiae bacterium]
MSLSLYDLLKRDVRKMVSGISRYEKGNIYPLIVQEVEKYIIEVVLEEVKYNYFRAAQVLGISRSTLYQKIKHLSIQGKPEKRQEIQI